MTIDDTSFEQRTQTIITKVGFDEIMDKLKTELEEVVRQELQIFYRMSGIMVQQMLFDAEQKGFLLNDVDVHLMENFKALEQIKDFEAHSKPVPVSLNPVNKGGLGSVMKQKLGTLQSIKTLPQQILTADTTELEEENLRLKQQVIDLQLKMSEISKRKHEELKGTEG